jgi:hypothetical protein
LSALFSITLFASAFLLFVVEPMIAKAVLPQLGGSPAVWNTCVVFFQVALLAGYALAHWMLGKLRMRAGVMLQVFLLAAAAAFLPYGFEWGARAEPPRNSSPIPWLIGFLAMTIGLAFLMLATMGPLLQKWFAWSSQRTAGDPYFLYGASNAGSMLALLSYPLVIEPQLDLGTQRLAWGWAYAFLVALTLITGLALWRDNARPAKRSARGGRARQVVTTPLTWARRARWLFLAFVPATLLLSVTTYLSMDIAAIPLLWIVPLALYLLSFILVFGRKTWIPVRWAGRALPGLIVVLMLLLLCQDLQPPIALLIFLHLLALFVIALYCHGCLSADRPAAQHLTEFYLWLAVGGALGGLFNALAAPVLFRSVAEYPLGVVCAAFALGFGETTPVEPGSWLLDWLMPAILGLVTVGLVLTIPWLNLQPEQLQIAIMFGVPAAIVYLFSRRPLRFALGVAAVLLAGQWYEGTQGRPLAVARSFFGIHRVTLEPQHNWHQIIHGNTVHGRQSLDPSLRKEPLTYYHRSGPAGSVFASLGSRWEHARFAVIGLGAGSLAAYAGPAQEWTFYEIDPVVETIARDPAYFTFLRDCQAKKWQIVMGDGRLRLAEAAPHSYDAIILDAFTSDAIPVHLLTREAIGVYMSKLSDSGLLLFHLSNRYLDLKPVVAGLAGDRGLICRFCDDLDLTPSERAIGKEPSQWAVLGAGKQNLGALMYSSRWHAGLNVDTPVWTDSFSSIFGLFKWE